MHGLPRAARRGPVAARPTQERDYIRALIAQGADQEADPNRPGRPVRGRPCSASPPAHGFNLTVYLLPPAILVVGIAIIAITLPRWRRRTRAAATLDPDHSPPPLDPLDQERLDKELSQFRG